MKNKHAVELGRLGGLVKSEAKRRACIENGKKGGRPKKIKISLGKGNRLGYTDGEVKDKGGKNMTTKKDLQKIGIEKQITTGYKTTYNGDGKHNVSWVRTIDGQVWVSKTSGGFHLAGNKKAPAGF